MFENDQESFGDFLTRTSGSSGQTSSQGFGDFLRKPKKKAPSEIDPYGPEVPDHATAPPIEKPANRPVALKPLTSREMRHRDAAMAIRKIEAGRQRAVSLFQEADRTPEGFDTISEPTGRGAFGLKDSTGQRLTQKQTLRARAEGELETANRLGEEAAKKYGDIVEVGFGADKDPKSSRRWVYAKPKSSNVEFWRKPSLEEQASASTREDIDQEIRQQKELQSRKREFEDSGTFGQYAQKLATRYLSGRPDLTPEEREDLAIRRQAEGVGVDRQGQPVGGAEEPGFMRDWMNRGSRALLDTIPSAASGLANLSDTTYRQAQKLTGNRLPEAAEWGPGTEKWAREVSNTLAPIVPTDPARDEDFTSKLASGAGSAAGFGVVSKLAGLAGVPSRVATGTVGAGLGADEIIQDARAAGFDPARDPDRWDRMVALGGASGMTEIFGFGKTLERWGLKRPFIKMALEVLEEGGQEALQQYLGNVNAAYVGQYDPNRPLGKDVLENAVIGGIIGGGAQVADVTAQKLRQQAKARAVAREPLAPLDLQPSVPPGTQTQTIKVSPGFLRQAAGLPELPSAAPVAAQPVIPATSEAPTVPTTIEPITSAAQATAQPGAPLAPLFPEAQQQASQVDVSTLPPQQRVAALVDQLRQRQEGRARAGLEQELNREYAEAGAMVNAAAETWDMDRVTAEQLATTGAARLKSALQNLQKSEAFQAELGAVSTGAAQPGPYMAAAQSIRQQLDQVDSLYARDAARERIAREQQAEIEKAQKQAEKDQRFTDREQQKLQRKLEIEQRRDAAAAKRMATAETAKEKRRQQLEQQRQQSRDERVRKQTEAELQRLAQHDAALKAADDAGARHQQFINQGMIAEAINELVVQQNQLRDAVRYLPRTPESQSTKADLNRYQGQIGNRIGDLKQQMRGRSVPVTRPVPPLFRPEAVVNPEGGVPAQESFYEPGAIFDRQALEDAEQTETPLLTAIRQAGGIRDDGITGGELRRLGVKESRTTGIVNNKTGLTPDRMREALAESGYLPQDSTVDDLYQAIEAEMRAGGRAEESFSDFYEQQAESEAPKARESFASFVEQFSEDVDAEDMAALRRAQQRSEAENPRDYDERTRPGEPGSSGVSFSPYNLLVENNRDAVEQLYDLNLNSAEAKVIVQTLRDYSQQNNIPRVHLGNLLNAIRNYQLEKDFWEQRGLSLETVQQSIDEIAGDSKSLKQQIRREAGSLPELRRTEIEREIAAIDALFEDPDMRILLDESVDGDEDSFNAFVQYGEKFYGVPRQTAEDLVYTRRQGRRSREAPRRNVAQSDAARSSRQGAQREKGIEPLYQLLSRNPATVPDSQFDRYLTSLEDWRNDSILGDDFGGIDLPESLAKDLRRKLAETNKERQVRVREKRLSAKHAPLPIPTPEQRAERQKLMEEIRDLSPEEQTERMAELRARQRETGESAEPLGKEDLGRAMQQQLAREAATVAHSDPAIDGKPILAKTDDGRVIVENANNKTGISVVKDQAETSAEKSDSQSAIRNPQSERGRLAVAVADFLATGKFPNILEARKFIGNLTGQQIKPGTVEAKKVDEAIEAGGVVAAQRIVDQGLSPRETFRALLDLHGRLPNLSVRTSTSVAQQAYSTPLPLAYVASELAGINQQTTVYEPTAGHAALLIATDPAKVTANELNNDRFDALKDILPGATVVRNDAAEWKPEKQVDRVIANPPFGVVKDDGGKSRRFDIDGKYKTSEIDHAVAFEALKAMKDNGRAVLIVAGLRAETEGARSNGYNTGAKRNFYFTLYNQYNVVDHFTVSGDLYAKQGAGFPVDVIVIDGRGKAKRSLPAVEVPQILRTWDEVEGKLNVRGSRQTSAEDSAENVRLGERGLPASERDSRAAERAADQPNLFGVPSGQGREDVARRDVGTRSPGVSGGADVQGQSARTDSRTQRPETGAQRNDLQQSATGRATEPVERVSGQSDAQPRQRAREADRRRNQPGAVDQRTNSGTGRTSDVESVFDEEFEKLFGEVAQPQANPTESKVNKTPENVRESKNAQPLKDAAKSAVRESGDTLKEIAQGLSELFGGPKLSSGLTFDEKTYAAAKPHFEAAMQHFQQATRDVREVMSQLLKALNERFGFAPDVLQKMKPYIVRFVEEQATAPQTTGQKVTQSATAPAVTTSQADAGASDTHRAYKPSSRQASVNTLVPVNMANAVEKSLKRLQEEVGDLDDFVADRLGYDAKELGKYFSGEQVDALAMAVRNIENGGALILGDQCVAGETRIYDPIRRTQTPIAELAKQGKPITVLALTPEGLKPASASAPFRKGEADLFAVTLDDGRVVTVTEGHRFLTPMGWMALRDGIHVGDWLASAESAQSSDRAGENYVLQENARNYFCTHEDSPGHCFACFRQGGGRSPMEGESDQELFPSPADALGRSRLWSRRDDPGFSVKYSHPCRSFDRLSRSSFSPSASRVPSSISARAGASVERSLARKSENALQSDQSSLQPHQERAVALQDQFDLSAFDWFQSASAVECHASEGHSRFAKNSRRTGLQFEDYARLQDMPRRLPVLAGNQTVQTVFSFGDYTGWRKIVSIKFVRRDEFYDLAVPQFGNYIAEGFINHNTGIGKGRVVAGVIRYAIKKGITPVFVTEKPTLYGDMIRDLADIGSADVKPLVTNSGESVPLDDEALEWYGAAEKAKLEGRPAPAKRGRFLQTKSGEAHNGLLSRAAETGNLGEYKVIFTTYNQMQSVQGRTSARHDLLRRFATNGIVIFDESHNAGGAGKVETDKRGEPKFDRAQFARQLAKNAKGVLYSSATFAKRPEVMDLYFRTELGDAVSDLTELSEITKKGGVPMQQVIASMLAEAGQYIRRERSFQGVEYSPTPVKVDRKSAENISRAMRVVADFDLIKQEAVKTLGERVKAEAKRITGDGTVGQAGVSSVNFTSLMHNLIDQSLLAMKVNEAADMAIAALDRGEKPVITVANTMGSFIQRYAEETELQPGAPINLSFNDLLARYLERSREVIVGKPYGEKFRHYLSDEELGEAGARAYESAKKFLESINLDIPISPIDWLHKRLRDAGYRTGEITGRNHIINYASDGPVYGTRPASETSTAAKKRTISAFNDGTMDVIILNQSGSTGISLHASEKFKDQRRRHMIIAQAEKNIDTHMQMLGRVHRTGQVIAPRYTQMVADIPAELRPAAVLGKKMASLNANTTASRSSAVTSKDTPDFLNKYGDEVAASLMESDPDLHHMLGRPLKESERKEGLEREDAMRKVTGRIPLLPIAEQEKVYELLTDEYNDALQQAEAMGENALEAKTLDLQAETTKTQTLVPGSGESIFEQAANVEKIRSNRQGKPFASSEVIEKLQTGLETESGDLQNLQRAGARKIRAMRGELEAEVAVYKNKIDEEYGDSKRGAVENLAADKWLNRWNQITGTVYPGATVQLAGGYGVVLSVERKGKRANPVALSGWRAAIAMTDARRQLQVPFSKIDFESSDQPNRVPILPATSATVYDPAKEDFASVPIIEAFDKGLSSTKETRYIVTGNLIAGFAAQPNGQIVNFTDNENRVRQGILMPAKFDPADIVAKRKEKLKSVDAVMSILDDRARGAVTDRNDNLAIRAGLSGGYVFSVPSAKGRGGVYYLNKALIRAAGNDFVKRGGLMEVQVGEAAARRMIDVLLKGEGLPSAVSLQAKAQSNAGDIRVNQFALDEAGDLKKQWGILREFDASNLEDAIENARIEVSSDPANPRAGILYVNGNAKTVIQTIWEGAGGARLMEAVALDPDALQTFAEVIRYEAGFVEGRTASQLNALADAFDQAAKDSDGAALINVSAAERGLQELARNHELFHVWQYGYDQPNNPDRQPMDVEWATAIKGYDRVRRDLLRRGYPDDPEDIVREFAAYAATDDLQRLGFSPQEARTIATDFLYNYFSEVAKQYGSEHLARIGRVSLAARSTIERVQSEKTPRRTTSGIASKNRGGQSQTSSASRIAVAGGSFSEGNERGREKTGDRESSTQQGFSFGRLESEPSGLTLSGGFGSQAFFDRQSQPKTTPLREIVAEHQPLIADPIKIQNKTLDEIVNAAGRGVAGSLPGARAIYWANKLRMKGVADRLANRQADYLSGLIEKTNEVIALSDRLAEIPRGTEEYEKTREQFDRLRVKIAGQLSRAAEYTPAAGYLARIYKSSLLSAPHIHLFNMLEQVFKLPLHEAQRAADLLVPAKILNKYGIPYNKAVMDFRDLVPAIETEIRGLGRGLREVPRDIVNMFRYGITRQMIKADDAEGGFESSTDKYELGHRTKGIPGFDQVLNFIGRSHGAADITFSNIVNATAIAAQANTIARKVGKQNDLTKEETAKLARDLAYEPSALMIALADDVTLRFKLDYPTLAYDLLQKVRNLPAGYMGEAADKGVGKIVDSTWKAAMDFIVPFSKIPLAAVDTYLFRYSPVAFARVAGRLAMSGNSGYTGRYKGEFAKERFGEDTAELFRQWLIGSLSWALLGALGSLGYLQFSGGREDDDDRRNVSNLRETMGVGYGPEVRAGDYAFNLNRMGPVGQAAGIGARIYQAQQQRINPKTGERDDLTKRAGRTVKAAKEGLLFNNPLGQAVKDIAGDETHSTQVGQFVGSKLRGFVPGFARDIAKIQTPTKKLPEETTTLGRLKSDIRSGMPVDLGFGSRAQMTDRVDALGRPVPEHNPFTLWRRVERDPQREEMERLNVGLPKPKREKWETAAEYNRRITGYVDPATGERVRGQADDLTDAMRRIAADSRQAGRSDEAKARIYSTELTPSVMKRTAKLSAESAEIEREIEAIRADAYETLRKLPAYQQMKEPGRKAARSYIDEQVKGYRARAASSRSREKAARMPEFDPVTLAQMAVAK